MVAWTRRSTNGLNVDVVSGVSKVRRSAVLAQRKNVSCMQPRNYRGLHLALFCAMDRSARPLAQCLQCARHSLPIRNFSIALASCLNVETTASSASEPPSPPPAANSNPAKRRDPKRVSNPQHERQLIRNQGILPIGSRRRRAALATSPNIQFHLLPYQCFQEARAFLQEDRQEKREQIQLYRGRIEQLQAKDVAPQDEATKEKRLADMRRKLEATKILADINDPIVKRKFEDGVGE